MIESLAINMLCFNAEGLIETCLRAILPFVDEARIIDTGSSDKTVEILQKLAVEYPCLHYRVEDIRYLGTAWIDYAKNMALTGLLNKLKDETQSEWILRIDDDEVWGKNVMNEIRHLGGNSLYYTIYYYHAERGGILDTRKHRNFGVVRLFKNIKEINWNGQYGIETVAFNGRRIGRKQALRLEYSFLHLGEFRTGIWKHDYRYHTKDCHCLIPVPKEYEEYIPR